MINAVLLDFRVLKTCNDEDNYKSVLTKSKPVKILFQVMFPSCCLERLVPTERDIKPLLIDD